MAQGFTREGQGISSVVGVADGGTGATTLTGVLTGNGVNPITGSAVTEYSVLVGDANNEVQEVSGTGTSGQVLTSNGAAALPTWQPSGGGGGSWVKISTQTAASSATIDFTDLSSTYISYMVIISGFRAVIADEFLIMRTSADNGVTYDAGATNYRTVLVEQSIAGTGVLSNNTSGIYLSRFGSGILANENASWVITIWDPTAEQECMVNFFGQTTRGGQLRRQEGGGRRESVAQVTAIRFLMTSGNISIGKFLLYGLVA